MVKFDNLEMVRCSNIEGRRVWLSHVQPDVSSIRLTAIRRQGKPFYRVYNAAEVLVQRNNYAAA